MPAKDLKFESILLITVPVKIGSEEYELREASGEAAAKYHNALIACSTLGPDGKPVRLEGLADVNLLLLSLCLYDKKTNELVPLKTIRSWPNRICEALASECKQISGLSEEEDDEETSKNLPDGTIAGSG